MLALLGLTTTEIVLALGCLFCLGIVASIIALVARSTARTGTRGGNPIPSRRRSLARRMRRCPDCLSRKVRRSRLRGVEHLLAIAFFLPYRCLTCYGRFLRLTMPFGGGRSTLSRDRPSPIGQANLLGASEETRGEN